MELCQVEHPTRQRSCSHQTWRPIHRTDRRLTPPTKIICRARAEELEVLGPACAALVLWRSRARIGRTGAEYFEAFVTLPRLVCSVDCARLRWILFENEDVDSSGTARTRAPVRSIDSLAASRVEISLHSFRVTRQACGRPRNKTRGDELSSGGQRRLREGSPFGIEQTKSYKSRTSALHAMYTARPASNTCKFYMFQGDHSDSLYSRDYCLLTSCPHRPIGSCVYSQLLPPFNAVFRCGDLDL